MNHKNETEDSTGSFNIQSPQVQPSTSFDFESRAERNKRLALERLAARKARSETINNGKLQLCTLLFYHFGRIVGVRSHL